MTPRTKFLTCLLAMILIQPALAAANNSRDYTLGLFNFSEVIDYIHDRYDADVDFAEITQEAWSNLETILPATAAQSVSANVPKSSSDELREFYLERVQKSIEKVARTQPDEATPTVRKLWNTATTGLVKGLSDDYSQYLPPKEHKELQRVLQGEPDEENQFYGVGISVDWDTKGDRGVMVLSPLPGTPAERNGIQAGDIITAVNGKPLHSLEGTFKDKLDKAIEMIKGEKDTEVTLTILKSGINEPVDVNLTRAPINPELHLIKEMLDDEIGYIRLYSFYASAAKDVLDAMRYLKTQGMQKLVIDFRMNPGGYLDQAVKVAEIFLPKGDLITYTKGMHSEYREFVDESNGTDGFTEMPMVILINEVSASASEVVTGALKYNDRATVIGKTSYGKGSVQEVFGLRGGAGLRLTVAKYYTPSDLCIDAIGITPDLEVDMLTREEFENLPEDYHNVSRLERLMMGDPQIKAAYRFLRGEMTLADSSAKQVSEETQSAEASSENENANNQNVAKDNPEKDQSDSSEQ